MHKLFEERPTEGMPDMSQKGSVDNPPQKEPQNIPLRMEEQPYDSTKENEANTEEDKIAIASKTNLDERMSDWGDSECGC